MDRDLSKIAEESSNIFDFDTEENQKGRLNTNPDQIFEFNFADLESYIIIVLFCNDFQKF